MEYIVKTGGRIVPTHLDQIIEDVPKKRAMIAPMPQLQAQAQEPDATEPPLVGEEA